MDGIMGANSPNICCYPRFYENVNGFSWISSLKMQLTDGTHPHKLCTFSIFMHIPTFYENVPHSLCTSLIFMKMWLTF